MEEIEKTQQQTIQDIKNYIDANGGSGNFNLQLLDSYRQCLLMQSTKDNAEPRR